MTSPHVGKGNAAPFDWATYQRERTPPEQPGEWWKNLPTPQPVEQPGEWWKNLQPNSPTADWKTHGSPEGAQRPQTAQAFFENPPAALRHITGIGGTLKPETISDLLLIHRTADAQLPPTEAAQIKAYYPLHGTGFEDE